MPSVAFGYMQLRAGLYLLRGPAFTMEMKLELCINVLSKREALQLYTLTGNSTGTLFVLYLRAQ